MAIIAKDSPSKFNKFPLPEAGTVQAVCAAVWDLGIQETEYKGEKKKQHKIVIAWELNQLINDPEGGEYHGKPYMLSKTYTLSLGEMATLRQHLESWRGKPFTREEVLSGIDLEKLYGVNCYLGVVHQTGKNGNEYANITAVLPLPKGIEQMKPVRSREEAPPKWVIEKQAQAIQHLDEVSDILDFPFGTPEEQA